MYRTLKVDDFSWCTVIYQGWCEGKRQPPPCFDIQDLFPHLAKINDLCSMCSSQAWVSSSPLKFSTQICPLEKVPIADVRPSERNFFPGSRWCWDQKLLGGSCLNIMTEWRCLHGAAAGLLVHSSGNMFTHLESLADCESIHIRSIRFDTNWSSQHD